MYVRENMAETDEKLDESKLTLIALSILIFTVIVIGAMAILFLSTLGSTIQHLGSTTITTPASWCLQPNATIATGCGGLGTGSYADGLYSQYSNWSKPAAFSSDSLWQVAYGGNASNLTIPSTCWAQSQLIFNITRINSNAAVQPTCYNGSAYINMSNPIYG